MPLWDAATGRTILTYQTGPTLADYVYAVAWSPDGKHLVTTPSDHTLQVWDSVTGRLILTYQGHTDGVYAVAWSPDGKYIASASLDGMVRVWNAP